MRTRPLIGLVRTVIASTAVAVVANVAFAQTAAVPPQPSKAQREQLALLHEQMAACLRSDKDMAACREEMHNKCRDMMGEQGCPMMGMGNHEGMMQHGPTEKP